MSPGIYACTSLGTAVLGTAPSEPRKAGLHTRRHGTPSGSTHLEREREPCGQHHARQRMLAVDRRMEPAECGRLDQGQGCHAQQAGGQSLRQGSAPGGTAHPSPARQEGRKA